MKVRCPLCLRPANVLRSEYVPHLDHHEIRSRQGGKIVTISCPAGAAQVTIRTTKKRRRPR